MTFGLWCELWSGIRKWSGFSVQSGNRTWHVLIWDTDPPTTLNPSTTTSTTTLFSPPPPPLPNPRNPHSPSLIGFRWSVPLLCPRSRCLCRGCPPPPSFSVDWLFLCVNAEARSAAPRSSIKGVISSVGTKSECQSARPRGLWRHQWSACRHCQTNVTATALHLCICFHLLNNLKFWI